MNNQSTMDHESKTAAVTGAANGIGKAIAERLALGGAHVVVIDIDDGTDTVDTIENANGSAEYREGDVTSEESMQAVLEDLELDILVNNAAYYAPMAGEKKRFDEIDEEMWNTVMDVNAKGVFIASKEALPRFDGGGSIVNISSTTALKGTTGFLHYVASKAAVLGMTRSLANELGDLDIRVNAVTPGFTESEASQQLGESYFQERVEEQAVGRIIQPEDIAEVVTYLCSAQSEMITGQVLNVDGGEVMY